MTVIEQPLAPDAIARKWDRRQVAEILQRYVQYVRGSDWKSVSPADRLQALAFAMRAVLIEGLHATEARYAAAGAKRLYYLSMEYLIGRSLVNNFGNLGLLEEIRAAVELLGGSFQETLEIEPDPPLGNGGLGRLAACFLDSLATLNMPGFGYGINYEFGVFHQVIRGGEQVEQPDQGLGPESTWLIARPDESVVVPIYGRIERSVDRRGEYNPMWMDWNVVIAVPHDMPIVGYGGHSVNWLRLFSARASSEFDIRIFNEGDYLRAVEQKIWSERVSKLLYPSDVFVAGRELRLTQEYFLVAAAVRDLVRRHTRAHGSIENLSASVAVQMNDTHPALAVAELMRMLVDEFDMPWLRAWEETVATLAFTNHTLMPEALEQWPLELMEKVVPRHLEIIREIDRRFHDEIDLRFDGDPVVRDEMSIIAPGPSPHVRMAHLAIAGSHVTNGVSELHSRLVRTRLVPHFAAMWPERFTNKTNGVTPRRWLLHCNRALARLITRQIGDAWITDLDQLRRLEERADDGAFLQELAAVKRANKERLARHIEKELSIPVDVDSLFDVQIKRIHEYKRQLLALLHIIDRYWGIVEDGFTPPVPRTFIFAGKAAPGYANAKLVIKLIHDVADMVRDDARARRWMNVVFLPDYRVTLAEMIVPAADLSEQISTAGTEASGTGNMKLALNGAVTVGTMDGANIEIMETVGSENVLIFGLGSAEVSDLLPQYDPAGQLQANPRLRRAVETLTGIQLTRHAELYRPLYDRLVSPADQYVHIADLPSYLETQERADRQYVQTQSWGRKSLFNITRAGRFSSDRTIREYASEIWNIESC